MAVHSVRTLRVMDWVGPRVVTHCGLGRALGVVMRMGIRVGVDTQEGEVVRLHLGADVGVLVGKV